MRWVQAAAALMLTGVTAHGQEPPARVARLVERLGSASFTDRNAAARDLQHLGADARADLERAAKSHDPEVRLRAERLLHAIKLDAFWQPGEYRGKHEQQPITQVLADLAKGTGNRLRTDAANSATLRDGCVDLDAPAMALRGVKGFWPLADSICRASGNSIRAGVGPLEAPGLVLDGASMGIAPIAYAGPLRGQIRSLRRTFIEELDLEEEQRDGTHTLQVNFSYLWEDRFHLVAYRSQPQLLEAVTDTGERVATTHSAGNTWNVVPHGVRRLSHHLMLAPPRDDARSLTRLRVSWELIAVGEFTELHIENLREPTSRRDRDVELTVERCEQVVGGWEVALRVSRELAIPEPAELLFVENQIEIQDDRGRPFVVHDQVGSLARDGAALTLRLKGPTEDSTPRSLRFRYPTLRAQRALELEYRDVPLPASRAK